MGNETETNPGDSILELTEPAASLPLPVIEHTEKGSIRSMWELLMQLRVLLPYLTRLVPLLDRGLLKASPDLSEVRKGIEEIQTGRRDLNAQVRNQTLQLERIEAQILNLREMGEHEQRNAREFSQEMQALRNWVRALAVLTVLLLAGVIVIAAVQFSHLGH